MAKQFWLIKSEPSVYSIDQLKQDGKTIWTGVRNYQARNFMRDQMKIGDEILFYHSNSEPTGIAGLAAVAELATADPTQFDKKDEYFEPRASEEKPVWMCVSVAFKQKFRAVLTLAEIKAAKTLAGMVLVQPGSRLSVQPVTPKQFETILGMTKK